MTGTNGPSPSRTLQRDELSMRKTVTAGEREGLTFWGNVIRDMGSTTGTYFRQNDTKLFIVT